MTNDMKLSEKGYLLQEVVHQDTIRREILVDELDFSFLPQTKDISGQTLADLSDFRGIMDLTPEDRKKTREKQEAFWKQHNIYKDENKQMAWYITEMCHPYNRRKPGDRFFWYNDIQTLSGTAGILMIRDGYVWSQKIIIRS